MTENSKQRIVNCPTCDKKVAWREDNKFRPFCSERCQLIDFGEWATEKNSIAGDPVFPSDDESEGGLQ